MHDSKSSYNPHLILISSSQSSRNPILVILTSCHRSTDDAIKTIVQRDYAECLQQLSLFAPGCEALKADPNVVVALDALVERAWSEEAKDSARGALMQLTGNVILTSSSPHPHLILTSSSPHHHPILTSSSPNPHPANPHVILTQSQIVTAAVRSSGRWTV